MFAQEVLPQLTFSPKHLLVGWFVHSAEKGVTKSVFFTELQSPRWFKVFIVELGVCVIPVLRRQKQQNLCELKTQPGDIVSAGQCGL